MFEVESCATEFRFGADSHEETLLESLGKLSEPGKPYKLSACKLPHHGSNHNVSKALVQALDCGARGFAMKAGAPEELLTAIRAVAHGETYVDRRLRPLLQRFESPASTRISPCFRG